MQDLLTLKNDVMKTGADYTRLSLIELTMRIAVGSDKTALAELQENRALFRYKDSRPLLMVDFLVKLKQQPLSRKWCNNNQMVLEQSFDLTLSKFLNMPQKNDLSAGKAETSGPDCRYYYRAFNNNALAEISSKGLNDELEIEFMAAKSLQNFVFRHFNLSCLECRRREQKLIRRVRYDFNGQTLSLWIPAEMTSKMFSKWFAENMDSLQEDNSLTRQDIQDILDKSLLTRKVISLEDIDDKNKADGRYGDFPMMIKKQISSCGLAETVADEKADNVNGQRPAIKELGQIRLKKLIHRVFDSLINPGNDYQAILAEFGLTKATFSRFAGSRWHKKDGSNGDYIPDLWKNTAHILANHPDFIEIVKEAGLWKNVCLAAGKKVKEELP